MATIRELQAEFRARADGMKSTIKGIREDMEGLGERTKSSAEKMSKSFTDAGKKMRSGGKKLSTWVTAPLAGLGGMAIKTGMDFEKSMSQVEAVSGATAGEMEKLEKQARDLGATTQFSASQASEAMGYLGMAGFETVEIMEAMPDLLNLASAGGLDMARSADIASNVLSGFNMEASETSRVADVMALTASSANTSVEQLGGAMSYVAPVAQGAGISIEETASAIGILSDAGIQGERAGTALRGMIASLQNPVGQTNDALEKLGLTFDDINPATNSLADILETLEESGMDSATAMQLVGVEAGPGLLAMLGPGSEGLREFTEELENAEGSAGEMSDIMTDNARGSVQEFLSALEELQLQFSEILLPMFRDLVEWLTRLVRWFGNLSPSIQKVITIVGLVASALGPLLIGLGFIASGIGSLIGLFGQLGPIMAKLAPVAKGVGTALRFITGPIGIVISLVGLLAIAIYKNWDSIYTWTVDTFKNVKDYLVDTWESAYGAVSDWLSRTKDRTVEIFTNIYDSVTGIASDIYNWVVDTVKGIWQAYVDFMTPIVDFVTFIYGTIFSAVFTIFGAVLTLIIEILKAIYGKFVEWLTPVFEFVRDTFQKVKDTATRIWNEIYNFFARILRKIYNFLKREFTRVYDTTSDTFSRVYNFLKNIWDRVYGYISDIVGNIFGKVSDTWSDLWGETSKIFRNIYEEVRKWFGNIIDRASELPGKIGDGIGKTSNRVISGVKKVINTLARWLGKGVNGVIGGVNWILEKIGSDTRVSEWKVPQWAHGTKRGSHPGGLAWVGDGKGDNSGPEMIIGPDGSIGFSPSKPTLVNMPAGTQVISAKETRALMDSIPEYALGTRIKDTAKSIGETLKTGARKVANVAGDVWDYVSNPSKLLDLALSKIGVELPTGTNWIAEVAKGAFRMVKDGAIEYVKDRLLSFGTGEGGRPSFGNLVMTSGFGYRIHPIFGTRRLHAGVDFAGPTGTPIPAMTGGQVTFSGPSGTGFGNLVKIRNGVMEFFYAHLSRALAQVGSFVRSGQIIGLLGNTGNSTGPHLHYEARRNGVPVNPMNLPGYANGGIINSKQLAWIAEGGWAESVISHDPSNIERSYDIWKYTGDKLGFLSDNSNTLELLERIARAVESEKGISLQLDSREIARGTYKHTRDMLKQEEVDNLRARGL